MKIAFAIEHYRPEQGGAERYAQGLASWLLGNGHAVDVFTRDAAGQPPPGMTVHALDVPDLPRHTRPARFASALTAALRNRTYDVVHAFNHAWPCDVLRLGGGVHLAFEKSPALSGGSAAARALRRWSYRLLPQYRALRENEVRQFDDPRRHFIAISHRVAGDMKAFYPACSDRIHVIHNGVDPSQFSPQRAADRRAGARARLGLRENEVALLFISNNYRLKGLHDLIETLPLIIGGIRAPVRLLVVGRGKAGPFEPLASALGVRDIVRFCGHTDALLDYYAAADLLVHPSYYDAFGFVCLEAAACGLPVVVSRNSGVSEIMKDGEGSVFVEMPCAREALADAIVRAAEPAFRARAKDVQRRIALEHTIERNYKAVSELHGRIAAEKQRRS